MPPLPYWLATLSVRQALLLSRSCLAPPLSIPTTILDTGVGIGIPLSADCLTKQERSVILVPGGLRSAGTGWETAGSGEAEMVVVSDCFAAGCVSRSAEEDVVVLLRGRGERVVFWDAVYVNVLLEATRLF